MGLDQLKPAASARQHLLLAGAMWAAVGTGVGYVGARWLGGGDPWLFVGAAAAGLLKSRFVLDRVAVAIAARIRARGDGRCLGGFLSLRSWALVLVMIGGGRLLRSAGPPPATAGFVYLAVGVALLASSRKVWGEWLRGRGEAG